MDMYFVIGTIIDPKGRYTEFWVEGWDTDEDYCERYANKLNHIHELAEVDEQVVYSVTAASRLRGNDTELDLNDDDEDVDSYDA